ncbi:imidazolonepropionase-like amidohydrolase [Kordia periserrulae]|uniref:Imidazolonepropionase-like amidohydrolase n=1 Tax=Kordia periserrulae TaxID=701523 RepID=A0A2T6BXQ3_9FLAO|nr:amidohydrolase family protein [Kordia periserrulae]PTX60861.1 imidazolonepropionase-like amidohydrolase [Kordia periserrulae]
MIKKLTFILLFCVSFSNAQSHWTYFLRQESIEKHADKKFVLSAQVKAEKLSNDGAAMLYVRISNKDRKEVFLDNMRNRPIKKNEWNSYQIEGTLDSDASSITFGGMVRGKGIFYFDDFELKVQEADNSWTTIPLKNASFEQKGFGKMIRFWVKDAKNKDYEHHFSEDTSDSSIGKFSLVFKSVFDTEEVNNSFKSKKLNANNEAILIENISVVDVVSGKEKIQSVLIRNQKIVEINKKIDVEDADILKIDGSGKWLLPGLIDGHIHLFQSGSLYTRPDAFDLRKYHPYEEEREWLRENAPDLLKRYLQNGITTVIDVGGPMYNYKIRDFHNDQTQFPNLYLTGPLISTYQPEEFNIEDSPIIKANSPEEAIQQVRNQLPFKPDFIKIWYINNGDPELNYKIVKATIEESHKHNLKVAVHATDLKTAKNALKANADILVHSVRESIDDKFLQAIKKSNVCYIPTLMVSNQYAEAYSQEISFTDEELRFTNPFPVKSFQDYKHLKNDTLFSKYKKSGLNYKNYLKKIDVIEAENLALLQKHNINIATGTDAGNIGTLHATSYQKEVKLMQKAGLSNLEVIQASTINAAKILDKQNEIGSIEVSKLADLIILEANPLQDLKALQEITHVIKAGSIYKREDILKESPENIVQKQVNAYNLKNLAMFLESFSDDVEIYTFPNTLEIKGKEELKAKYATFFEKYPKLHCEILNRTIKSNTIIDHERVTYTEGDYGETIAIYKIENGKIAKVYFIRD